eukprot:Seg1117.2 transcript_id=Seg1117.2/GoldUCD/mRNA.D3Y31 product="hypothetical protein" protein_id=Seg1117.2/GoldUCD/D3Y31
MDLPTINGANPVKIHEFFEKLVTHVQAMETMGKLKTINGYVRLLLDRLPGIRSDLVRNDDNWDSWEFPQLVEALRKWTERNPIASEKKDYVGSPRKFDRTLQTDQKQWKGRKCVYCGGDFHKASNCSKISSLEARRQVVSKKRLCFNCLGSSHRAAECRSKQGCMKCGSRHHTSICDKPQEAAEQTMMTSEIHPVTYPVVVVKVNGVKCRALLDTGAGSSYASATLINKLDISASRTENRKIEMMMHTAARKIQIYNLKITNCEEDFEIYTDVSKVDKSVLLSVANPKYDSMIKRYQHLKGVKMIDTDSKSQLPIHLVLGASEYSRIKTSTKPRIGDPGDPLKRQPTLYEDYHGVIQEYLEQGIVERVPENKEPAGKVFYIPHKAVVRENAESTKLRVVFDASARQDEKSPSLNDCLETGPSLLNLLWSIIVRNRLKPIALAGDLKKAFLQVRIREEDRDTLRFHWIKDIQQEEVEVLRFTRALFGLTQSPFLLGGTLEQHLLSYDGQHAETIEEIRRSLYVDDVISGGCTIDEMQHFKARAIQVFKDAGFSLHKWHSNERQLEGDQIEAGDNEQTYAKQQLGVIHDETKLLGLQWSKSEDKIAVTFPTKFGETTKRGVLQTLASIYDPIGIVSPVTLRGKVLFRELCDAKISWDQELPDNIAKRWKRYTENLPIKMEVVRSLCTYRETIDSIELHAFGDASEVGTSACVYAVVHQSSGISQAVALKKPPTAKLPVERTTGDRPYQVIGLDFAGPITYKKSEKVCGKAYILLFTCSLTRALCLELLPDQSLELFLPTLKRFFARRGRPDKIYSDNFSTFVAASRWLKKAMRSEKIHDYLSSNNIKWQFNLSRAAWWGGQFERMVGLTKQALFKVVGKTTLTWNELVDVLLDVELTLNNRPLSYVEDDVQMPILTPNVMLFGQPNYPADHDIDDIDDRDLRKRARHLNECKKRIWNRWSNEYLKGLRERHNLKHHGKTNTLNIGDVMLIKGEEKNRGQWRIGIIQQLITGRDGIVRGAKLRAGKSTLERAVQHLYPLELQCDDATVTRTTELNADAREFRPRRDAAAIATLRMKDQMEEENQEPLVEW